VLSLPATVTHWTGVTARRLARDGRRGTSVSPAWPRRCPPGRRAIERASSDVLLVAGRPGVCVTLKFGRREKKKKERRCLAAPARVCVRLVKRMRVFVCHISKAWRFLPHSNSKFPLFRCRWPCTPGWSLLTPFFSFHNFTRNRRHAPCVVVTCQSLRWCIPGIALLLGVDTMPCHAALPISATI
jgi:hypothetical protein